MKKVSIKVRITLWFSIFLMIITVVVFAFIGVVSYSTTSAQQKAALIRFVNDNWNENIELDDGKLHIDDDFVSYKNGMYVIVLDENGQKISGYAPSELLVKEPLMQDRMRSIVIEQEKYLLYDQHPTIGSMQIWIRGIALENAVMATSSATTSAVLMALPLLLVLAVVGGYWIASRSLQPIQKISQTAQSIGNSGNLNQRIDMASTGDELNQLAGTFNHMFDRLEKNFEAEKQFTSDAAHELRTPVTTILAQCEYALDNMPSEQELYEVIGSIHKQGQKMSRLIELLLNFTRMEQGTEKPSLSDVDFSSLVKTICEEQSNMPENNITLHTEITSGIIMAVDPLLASQILENLIRNAYRYGKENGHIYVSLQQLQHDIILSVKDDGIGINADQIDKIFNRFYRVDQSRSSLTGKGLGLGLAMVKQMVTLLGGTIEVESMNHAGSTFTIHFPQSG